MSSQQLTLIKMDKMLQLSFSTLSRRMESGLRLSSLINLTFLSSAMKKLSSKFFSLAVKTLFLYKIAQFSI
jgi:hypothetical protein